MVKQQYEKEFLEAFTSQVLRAKERQEKEGKKKKVKKVKKPIKKIKKIKPSETIRKLEPLTIEKEKIAPIYKRIISELPEPPKAEEIEEWPLVPPRPPARPPEEEAATAPAAELQAPAPPPTLRPETAPTTTTLSHETMIQMDLEKLNPLVSDPSIRSIHCDGPNKPLKIRREAGIKIQEIKITLNEDEINTLIQKFAVRTGQALKEPVFKATVGNLSLTAIVSEFAGSKFILTKTL